MHPRLSFMLRQASRLTPVAVVTQLAINTHTDCASFSAHTYPANDPTEDRHVMKNVSKWGAAAVFDGHGGWQVSNFVSQCIVDRVVEKIQNVDEKDELTLDTSIAEVFESVEQEIRMGVRNAVSQGSVNMVKVGSCALLAFKKGDRLILANCGDCRAILGTSLGKINESSIREKYVSTRINRDHNARVRLEQLRLEQDHPDESNLVVCKNPHACYVKGRLQLTRSLGDLYLKDMEFNEFRSKSARFVPDPYSPPYVSHQPDMHHLRLSANDRFVILATDGVWDYLSDQEAVDIVSACMAPTSASPPSTYYDWWCGVYKYFILGTAGENAERREALQKAAAARIVQRALEIAAAESGMTPAQLRALPVGNARRYRHDDTTAVVMYF